MSFQGIGERSDAVLRTAMQAQFNELKPRLHQVEFQLRQAHGLAGHRGLVRVEVDVCIAKSQPAAHCLGRRIADLALLSDELAAWTYATNADERQVDWRFTTSDARIKLRHLYPAL